MKQLNLSGPQDVMALLVRRKWWILIPFAALSSAVVLLTFILPKVYVSQALILIQPRDVPTDLVRNLIAGTTEERLSSIEQTVLSHTQLVAIANEFLDQLPEIQKLDMDQRVDKLRHQIKLIFKDDRPGSGQLPVTYFRITFENQNRVVAQKIAEKVTGLFITQDNLAREKQVDGTVKFLQDQANELAEKLKGSDARLKELRARRSHELPTQLDTNLRGLDNAESARQNDANILQQQQQGLLHLEEQLSDTPETIPKPVAPVVIRPPAPLDPKIEEYRAVKAQLNALTLKGFKDQHPDVLGATKQLERLKKDMSTEQLALADKPEEKPTPPPSPSVAETMPNPAYKNLVKLREDVKLLIKLTQDKIEADVSNIKIFSARIANEPQAESELVDIVRENTDLNDQYQKMRTKLSDSSLSSSLETASKGAQFLIVDPANLPTSPAKPKKSIIAAVGTLVSLLVGVLIGFVVDIANQKMWTLSDVETLLGTTVLVEIPEIVTPTDLEIKKKKRLKYVASLAAVSAAYGFGLYFLYLHQGFVLRHLDPLLQRLY